MCKESPPHTPHTFHHRLLPVGSVETHVAEVAKQSYPAASDDRLTIVGRAQTFVPLFGELFLDQQHYVQTPLQGE